MRIGVFAVFAAACLPACSGARRNPMYVLPAADCQRLRDDVANNSAFKSGPGELAGTWYEHFTTNTGGIDRAINIRPWKGGVVLEVLVEDDRPPFRMVPMQTYVGARVGNTLFLRGVDNVAGVVMRLTYANGVLRGVMTGAVGECKGMNLEMDRSPGAR